LVVPNLEERSDSLGEQGPEVHGDEQQVDAHLALLL